MSLHGNKEHLRERLDSLIGLYKHHLDLFWKWITLYVTIVSAIGAYIFNKDILPPTKRLLPLLIAASSFGIAIGCLIMWSWIKELKSEIERISEETSINYSPSLLGVRMTIAALVATILFGLLNILYSIYGDF